MYMPADDALVNAVHEKESLVRWHAGKKPGFSTGLGDELTAGYGECDWGGYWQFPLYPAEEYLNKSSNRKI